ncbi:hypothetical protein CK203_019567 [Vitis vinifera]|uniref:Uncharacterized protein n=1 Tax=Vitis vinifera TaxID=29760 RepID=A0A438IYW2_VITVI|nr:hypothetical protein CK203_019567 [Vitis vinifera]
MYWPSLTHLNLGDNNLSGKLPNSVGSYLLSKHCILVKGRKSEYDSILALEQYLQALSFKALTHIASLAMMNFVELLLQKTATKKEDFQGVNHIEESREDFELPWFYIGFLMTRETSSMCYHAEDELVVQSFEKTPFGFEMFKGLQPREKGGKGRWWIVIKRLEENIPGHK